MRRDLCLRCLKARATCYCHQLRPFTSRNHIVILQHKLERKRTVGSARMAHLSIQNSTLIPGRGADFDTNETLLSILADPARHCVVLYPGPQASNISEAATDSWLPAGKICTILVIDGTWHCAKTMLRESKILRTLPQICFTPGRESEYQFRRQPAPHCLSTIEAIHEVLNILEPGPQADELLFLFRSMVAQQIAFHPRPLS